MKEEIQSLGPEWVNRLYEAAIQGDGELILEVINPLREQHQELVDMLAGLVHNFRFDVIVDIAKPEDERV